MEATLSKERQLSITETIEYDFGNLTRHGIYRVIPERYDRNGAKYRYRYRFGEATIDGKKVKSKITHEGDAMRIRLGDASKTVTGKHTYTITYTTDRAINDFPEEDVRELYWNVTGNDWNIPIQEASFTLKGPGEASDIICFTGVYGSIEKNCGIQKDGTTITIKTLAKKGMTTAHLSSLEGMTVAIRYPEALIAPVFVQTKIIWFLSDNWWVFIPVIVFALMYGVWYVKGRDPDRKSVV